MKEVVTPLLNWYSKEKRDLPWRHTRDPYKIWISEIMLQQTRVEAVIGYYDRFIAALPDIRSLAEVSDDELMKLWEGLGYYSRARNLKKAALLIVNEYGGIFPDDPAKIAKLPGIGPYTTGSISSIAFNHKMPAVDGNVLRVLSRLQEDDRIIQNAEVKRDYEAKLKDIYPDDASSFTQSLMELGALVCLPQNPRCTDCPIASFCMAHQNAATENYPKLAEKKNRKIVEMTVFILVCEDRYALRKREQKLLHGLYEFPNEERKLSKEEVKKKYACMDIIDIHKHISKKHIFTHIEWRMTSWIIETGKRDDSLLWLTKDEIMNRYAIPAAFEGFI